MMITKVSSFTKSGMNWFCQSSDLLTYEEAMPCLRQKHILTGYRPRKKSVLYYIKSVFQLNNETVNFWTHFLPLLHFVYIYSDFYNNTKYSTQAFCYPYYAHGLGCCLLLAVSSFSHMFWAHSEEVNYNCGAVDRACIFTYGLSIHVGGEYYACPMNHFCNWRSTAVQTLIIFSAYYTLSFAAVLFVRTFAPKLERIVMLAGIAGGAITGYSPCVLRYYFGLSPHPEHISFHTGHDHSVLLAFAIGTLILGAFLYGLRVPERFSPGSFDIVGWSHQWMHVFTAVSMYAQNTMLRKTVDEIWAKLDSGHIDKIQLNFSIIVTVGVVMVTAILINISILLHWYLVRRDVQKHKNQ